MNEHNKTILVMGGSGFIGSALCERLAIMGYKINLLTRSPDRLRLQVSFPCSLFAWNGKKIPADAVKGVCAVVNLVGQGIADKAWSKEYRKQILDSRIDSVEALYKALEEQKDHPEVIIQASAMGYYFGSSDHQEKVEDSEVGGGFLSEVCKAWEESAKKLEKFSRLARIRIGLVLGWEGGALPQLWNLYSMGLGSSLGSGKQWMNWIHVKDLVGVFVTALEDKSYSGPYNGVAPGNISNKEFHKCLSEYTRSFSWLAAPSISLKMIMGARSSLLLDNYKVVPKKLEDAGFKFNFGKFNEAMTDLLSERQNPKYHYFTCRQWLPKKIEEIWPFFADARNLEKITPPWLKFKVVAGEPESIGQDSSFKYALKIHGLPIKWHSKIKAWIPNEQFTDIQTKGPYRLWSHRHLFHPLAGGTLMEDRVEYGLPFAPFSHVALPFVQKDLNKIFSYRKKVIADLLGNGNA
ncbi:MAG: TIGR01777 family protein [Oligoflexales bacterium]|nr:TIGR01777 family protein [Oligoflexales bacterium]